MPSRNANYTRALGETPTDSKVALIDIGSNSVRLVIYDGIKRAPLPLFNQKVLCGLAQGLATSGKLNPEGTKSAESTIARFLTMVQVMNVVELHVFATAAIRAADDGEAFVKRLETRHQIHIDVISGEREAELAAHGVMATIYKPRGIAGDLGGGSFELVQINEGNLTHQTTLPLGVLQLLDIGHGQRDITRKHIETYLKTLPWDKYGDIDTFYAIGGSFRAIARLHLAKSKYPYAMQHQYEVKADEIQALAKEICKLSHEKRKQLPGASNKRAHTYVPAVLVLERMLKLSGAKKVIFSTGGVREGYLYDYLSPYLRRQDPLLATCADMATRTGRPIRYGQELFDWMSPLFAREDEMEQRLRKAFCLISELGWRMPAQYRADWAYHHIMQSTMMGISHPNRSALATALYCRNQSKIKKKLPYDKLINKTQWRWAQLVGQAAFLAYTLSGSEIDNLKDSRLDLVEDEVQLYLSTTIRPLMSDGIASQVERLGQFYHEYTSQG